MVLHTWLLMTKENTKTRNKIKVCNTNNILSLCVSTKASPSPDNSTRVWCRCTQTVDTQERQTHTQEKLSLFAIGLFL